jgi:hypothetical protein
MDGWSYKGFREQNGNKIEMGYIVLSFVTLVFTLIFFGNRWRLTAMLRELNATMVGKTIWFCHQEVLILLNQTSAFGTYSWASAKKRWGQGFAPLFTLSIPIEKDCFWFIRQGEPMFFEKWGRKGIELELGGKKLYVWAQDENRGQHLVNALPSIVSKLESVLASDIGWGNISSDRGPRWYRWRPHFGWFIDVTGLPEGLNKNPAQVLKIADTVVDMLGVLNVSAKKAA